MEHEECGCHIATKVLTCPMGPNDAGAKTVGAYVLRLAQEAWKEGECFSGYRPFGNSSWEREVYAALAAAGLIESWPDRHGELEYDNRKSHALMGQAIAYWLEKVSSPR